MPFSIQDKSVNEQDPNYDLVIFWVNGFGELLIAGVDYFSDDVLDKNVKQHDSRTVLSKLASAALYMERGFPTRPKVVEDTYLSTPYGEALLRVYMAEKGSMQISAMGRRPTAADTFDTLIAVIVVLQKNNFIYVMAENDNEGQGTDRNKEALKREAQAFFSSIVVHR